MQSHNSNDNDEINRNVEQHCRYRRPDENGNDSPLLFDLSSPSSVLAPPPPPPPQQQPSLSLEQQQQPEEEESQNSNNRSSSLSYMFIYLTFLFLGIGQLLPWNAFISAESYFQSRFCSSGSGGGGEDDKFELWFGLIFHITGIVPLGLMLLWEWKKECQEKKEEEEMEVPLSLSAPLLLEDNNSTTRNKKDKNKVQLPNNLILPPLLLSLFSLLLTTLLVFLPSSSSSSSSFFTVLTYICIAITGVTCSIVGVGNLALSRIYPTNIGISPLMNGLAFGGFVLSIVNFVSSALSEEEKNHFWVENCANNGGNGVDLHSTNVEAYNNEEEDIMTIAACPAYTIDWGAFTYFGLGSFVLGICVMFFIILRKLSLTEYFMKMAQRDCCDYSESDLQNDVDDDEIGKSQQQPLLNEHHQEDCNISLEQHPQQQNDDDENESTLINEMVPMTQQSVSSNKEPQHNENEFNSNNVDNNNTKQLLRSIWKIIQYPTLAIFFSLFVIFTLFPAWTSRLESVHKCNNNNHNNNRLSNDLFIPMTIIVFNTFDLLGRIVAGKVPLEKIQNVSGKILCASLCMFIFLPLFMLCNTSSSSSSSSSHHHHHYGWIIKSDVYTIVLIACMAFANGFIITCAFSHGPRLLPPDGHVQELASTIMNFVVALSALLGSLVSFPYVWIATA